MSNAEETADLRTAVERTKAYGTFFISTLFYCAA